MAIFTVALGVGANTAGFRVGRPCCSINCPHRQPDRLVQLAQSDVDSIRPITVDFTTTYDLRARSRSFEHMSLYRTWSSALAGQESPELLNGLRVNYDFFDTLGVKMQLGRNVQVRRRPPAQWHVMIKVAVFGSAASVQIERDRAQKVQLDESTFTIVGVLPAGFQPPPLSQTDSAYEMFAPLGYELNGPSSCRGCRHLRLIGRLKPGVAPESASAE